MDEAVRRAMARWPNVPAVFGWLALDGRGQWLIRGEPIGNPMVVEFIGRNYAADAHGRWYFQNGPQRVFCSLGYCPWVLRLAADGFRTHTSVAVTRLHGAWIDRAGVLVLATELGAAILDDRDLEAISTRFVASSGSTLDDDSLSERFEQLQMGSDARLELQWGIDRIDVLPIETAEVPRRLGFVRDPQPLAGESASW